MRLSTWTLAGEVLPAARAMASKSAAAFPDASLRARVGSRIAPWATVTCQLSDKSPASGFANHPVAASSWAPCWGGATGCRGGGSGCSPHPAVENGARRLLQECPGVAAGRRCLEPGAPDSLRQAIRGLSWRGPGAAERPGDAVALEDAADLLLARTVEPP